MGFIVSQLKQNIEETTESKSNSKQNTDTAFEKLPGARPKAPLPSKWRNNLLQYSVVSTFVFSRMFPSTLRWINMIVLASLIYLSWGATEEIVRYTNFGSWVVWVIWWPIVIGSALFAGRLWCTICHLRLVSDWFSAIGLKITPPKWFEKHGTSVTLMMVAGLIVLHSSVISYDVHHIPHYTALYLVVLVAYAVIVSLIFKKGTFCKLFCPLVAFFAPYSQLSPTEMRSIDLATCLKCGSNQRKKMCYKSCTNGMMMQMRSTNANCLLCFKCVKTCPNQNIRFGFRGLMSDLWKNTHRSGGSVLAGIILIGIIFQELGEEWEFFESIMLALPSWIAGLGVQETVFGGYMWLETVCVNIVLPLLFMGAAGALAWGLARKESVLFYVKLYGIGLLPLVFCAHFSKLIKTFNEKFGYVSHVFSDPFGYETAAAIQAGTLIKPLPFFVSNFTMGWILLVFVAIGTGASIYSSIRIARNSYTNQSGTAFLTVAPFISLYFIFGIGIMATIFNWLII